MLDFSVTFLITIINITVLFLILRAVLFKPVTKFMEDRTRQIRDSLDQVDKDKSRAQKLLAEYNAKLDRADSEADEIIKNAREQAEDEAREIVANGKEKAASIIEASRKHIEAEHQAALAKFKIEAAALVIAASSRLASREFSGDDNKRYANMLLDELAAQKGKY